jgi:hypothetical protein
VVITILSILASMVLFALASATESARVAKTKSTINKLNDIIMAKFESYRTRRVPISTAGMSPELAAKTRVDGIRELMRMELPERITDITDGPMIFPAGFVPSVTRAYRSKIASVSSANYTQYETAKCLYLVVRFGCDDPDVMEQFKPDEFTTDSGDGLSYFVDGWGRPINFLRWAPGFSSPLHAWDVNYYTSSKTYPASHDSFDPLHIYKPASGNPPDPFYNSSTAAQQVYPPLYPLIYSPGPDGNSGIYDENVNSSNAPIPLHYANRTPANNPYAPETDGSGNKTLLGCYIGGNSTDAIDDITNHDIGESQ